MTQTSPTIRVDQHGGTEAMHLVDLQVGEPGPGEIRIRHHACGLNFIDVYQRSGVYQLPMPLSLGMEGAGVVEAVGEGVTHLKAGDRAAYASNPPGSYSTLRVMPAKCVVKLPDAIDFETGAAMMLKGLTAQYLLKKTLPQEGLQSGDFVLFHAAAGGVGLIACQWAKALGLQLIGTAGSDQKCALAREHGAAFTINYREQDFAARVKEMATAWAKRPAGRQRSSKATKRVLFFIVRVPTFAWWGGLVFDFSKRMLRGCLSEYENNWAGGLAKWPDYRWERGGGAGLWTLTAEGRCG